MVKLCGDYAYCRKCKTTYEVVNKAYLPSVFHEEFRTCVCGRNANTLSTSSKPVTKPTGLILEYEKEDLLKDIRNNFKKK